MFKRLKRALVQSYIGAIALGFIFSTAITQFAYAVITPIGRWAMQQTCGENEKARIKEILVQAGLPSLIGGIVLLLIGSGLLRWLYYTPVEIEPSVVTPVDGLS